MMLLYDKLCSEKFSLISLLDVTQHSNQLMYSLCFPIHYYDSNDIKFNTVMKEKLKNLKNWKK